ncbi:PREDICTED: uncharacterized protein LOC105143255 isoform X3 [Acromyrmex echinatior]|uniref:uncharacterized protein LOC105143255 isoform X3 n=1 Tax=Acromyrmex echinatior TaxID=103372 RepID=UPI000580C16A|nr:PREDICTED: uncharacterized protein LOC105143255 isoform X3 [Acromyrmex echinatior]
MQRDAPPSENSNASTSYSVDLMDEMFIDAVEQRPGLWNQKLPVQSEALLYDKSCGMKFLIILDVAWMKSRWTYLRDCYSKARKKMKGYVNVRSGSDAETGHPQKSTFRFYLRMQFLDEAVQEIPCYNKFSIMKHMS